MKLRTELHTHSTESDGRFEPRELAELCAEHDVDVWSLTDHDTCSGCSEAREAAEALDIRFVPGIEISAYRRESVHVLGYGVAPESGAIRQLDEQMQRARRSRMARMVESLRDRGVDVRMEDVDRAAGSAAPSRAHLARALVTSGVVDDEDAAFDRHIGTDSPVYEPVTWPSVVEAVEIVDDAGGVAVLAHPGRYDVDDLIPEWVDAGLAGIEVVHPAHDADMEERYRELAGRLELFETASCDFHGDAYPEGAAFGTTRLERDSIAPILG